VKKFRLLLLDANIVIEISRHRLWGPILERCDIYLARTVVEEAHFFVDDHGDKQPIDLAAYVNAKFITVFDLTPSDLAALRAKFDPVYLEKLDPGETESLAFLLQQGDACQICSADKIVYRILGNMHCSEQGVSLEEVLKGIGLERKLAHEFSREYRERWTQNGFKEKMHGIGFKG
jgi:hypothetical protein